jgi:crossover junction endodeoxyribonuclease RuvC
MPRRRQFQVANKRSEQTVILGIDVGISGAVCAYDFHTHELLALRSMPLRETGAKDKKWIDVATLGLYLDFYAHQTLYAVVEQPSAMPKQGVVSTFRFGHACGIVEGILGGLQIPTILVRPAIWKSAMGLNSSKDLSRERAKQYFPFHEHLFQRKKDDGLAEAALLAIYGERFARIVNTENKDE